MLIVATLHNGCCLRITHHAVKVHDASLASRFIFFFRGGKDSQSNQSKAVCSNIKKKKRILKKERKCIKELKTQFQNKGGHCHCPLQMYNYMKGSD